MASAQMGDQFDLARNAERVLAAIAANGDRANTSEIRQATGLSSSNISGTHARTLVREGLARVDGQEDVGQALPANVYVLTPEGQRVARTLEADTDAAALHLEVERLRDRVDELESQVETHDSAIDNLGAVVRRLRDRL